MHCQHCELCRPYQLLEKEDHLILENSVAREINVLNYVIVSHRLGHCDLFSYKSFIKVLYNSRDQVYIFLYSVVPHNSIMLEINSFHMFLQNKIFFRFSYRAQPGISYFFLFSNLSYHPC